MVSVAAATESSLVLHRDPSPSEGAPGQPAHGVHEQSIISDKYAIPNRWQRWITALKEFWYVSGPQVAADKIQVRSVL